MVSALRGSASHNKRVNNAKGTRATSGSPRQQKETGRGRGNNSRLDPVSRVSKPNSNEAFVEARTEAAQDFLATYSWITPELRAIFTRLYIDSGNGELALNQLRNGEGKRAYDKAFPGNRREDGSLRYDENQYLSVANTYKASWRERGLDVSLLTQSRIGELIGGDVSPQEFEGRVSAVEEQVVLNLPEVLRAFTEQLGVSATREAALASLLDPSINDALLNRQISVSQIRGEASRFGFTRSFDRGDRLAAAGVNQGQARQFFSGAATALPSLDIAATRFGEMDESVDLEEFEEAALLDDPFQRQRIQRLQRRQQSEFSQSAGVLGAGGGALAGLDEV